MQALSAGRRPLLLLTLLCALLYLPGQMVMPPFDRDEARFAQASKQTLQESRWIVPYFQDSPRSKKPAGIYWLQAGSVAAAKAVTGDASVIRAIWAYRIPSLIGAWLSVLLTFAIGAQLFDRRAALIGAALLGSSLLLTVEAHLAKTDAVLLATILLAIWGLARAQMVWLSGGGPRQAGRLPWWAYWGGLGLSAVIKGPIGPVVVGLATLGQRVASGTWRWGRFLEVRRGLPVLIVLAGAWPLALVLSGAGGFMMESANEDLIPKLISAQESHGAPPGSYLAALLLTFWPGSLVVVPALVAAWWWRHEPGVRFCLAWIIPGWIMFALVPTKLPHYVLPFFPALALLAGHMLIDGWPRVQSALWRRLAQGYGVLWTGVGAVLAVAFVALESGYGDGPSLWAFLLAAHVIVGGLLVLAVVVRHDAGPRLAGVLVLLSVLVWPMMAQVYVPRLHELWIARTVAQHLPPPDARPALAAAGYHEPSLVFMNGTATKLTNPDGVAQYLAETPNAYGLILKPQKPRVMKQLAERDVTVETVAAFEGFNYSKGRSLRLILLHRSPRDDE